MYDNYKKNVLNKGGIAVAKGRMFWSNSKEASVAQNIAGWDYQLPDHEGPSGPL